MGLHSFEIQSEWNGGLSGQGILKSKGFESRFSAPAELKGPGVGTNPEELLGAAAGGCLLITLAAILQFQEGIQGLPLKNRTEVVASSDGKIKITGLNHRLSISLPKDANPDLQAKILSAVGRAEKACLIGQSLNSNVVVTVNTEFIA